MDHEILDTEVGSLIEEVEIHLRDAAGGSGEAYTEATQQCTNKLKRARKLLAQLKVEQRQLENPTHRKVSTEKTDAHTQKISTLSKRLDQVKAEHQAKIAESQQTAERVGSRNQKNRQSATEGVKSGIRNTQNETLALLKHSEGIAEDTNKTADETAQLLGEQTDQLQNIQHDLKTLDGNIARARGELKKTMIGLAKDRLLIALLAVAAILLLIYIGYRIYSKAK